MLRLPVIVAVMDVPRISLPSIAALPVTERVPTPLISLFSIYKSITDESPVTVIVAVPLPVIVLAFISMLPTVADVTVPILLPVLIVSLPVTEMVMAVVVLRISLSSIVILPVTKMFETPKIKLPAAMFMSTTEISPLTVIVAVPLPVIELAFISMLPTITDMTVSITLAVLIVNFPVTETVTVAGKVLWISLSSIFILPVTETFETPVIALPAAIFMSVSTRASPVTVIIAEPLPVIVLSFISMYLAVTVLALWIKLPTLICR